MESELRIGYKMPKAIVTANIILTKKSETENGTVARSEYRPQLSPTANVCSPLASRTTLTRPSQHESVVGRSPAETAQRQSSNFKYDGNAQTNLAEPVLRATVVGGGYAVRRPAESAIGVQRSHTSVSVQGSNKKTISENVSQSNYPVSQTGLSPISTAHSRTGQQPLAQPSQIATSGQPPIIRRIVASDTAVQRYTLSQNISQNLLSDQDRERMSGRAPNEPNVYTSSTRVIDRPFRPITPSICRVPTATMHELPPRIQLSRSSHIPLTKAEGPVECRVELPGVGSYQGEMVNGTFHGYGELRNSDAKLLYKGGFERGAFGGYGVLHCEPTGAERPERVKGFLDLALLGDYWRQYEGQFEGGAFEGVGQLFFANDDRFLGEFKANAAEGIGVYFGVNGTPIIGFWSANKLIERV